MFNAECDMVILLFPLARHKCSTLNVTHAWAYGTEHEPTRSMFPLARRKCSTLNVRLCFPSLGINVETPMTPISLQCSTLNMVTTTLDKISRKIIQSHVCTGHSSEDYNMVQGAKALSWPGIMKYT